MVPKLLGNYHVFCWVRFGTVCLGAFSQRDLLLVGLFLHIEYHASMRLITWDAPKTVGGD